MGTLASRVGQGLLERVGLFGLVVVSALLVVVERFLTALFQSVTAGVGRVGPLMLALALSVRGTRLVGRAWPRKRSRSGNT